MNNREMHLILDQLVEMEPSLEEVSEEAQYKVCYNTYQAMDGRPEDYTLQELIDARTLKKVWYWRKKS